MKIGLKRAYEPPTPDDGMRVLVDRLWPRGLAKSSARIDLWEKEIAPSSELRTWFAHDPLKWAEFRRRYFRELDHNPAAVARLRELAQHNRVTLAYAAQDPAHNNAVVLKAYLERDGEDDE